MIECNVRKVFSPMISKLAIAAVVASSSLIPIHQGIAALIVSDSFAYGGDAIIDLATAVPAGSVGLTGSWGYSTGGKYWSYTPDGGLTMGDYGGQGGSARFSQSNFAPSAIERSLQTPLAGGTYYLGYLFSIAENANNGSVSGLLLGDSGAGSNTAPVMISSDEYQSDFGGSRVNGTASINSGQPITGAGTFGTTYLSLSKVTFGSGSITIDRYILNADQLAYFQLQAGGLDASLNLSLTTGTAAGSVLELGTQTVTNATTTLPFIALEGYANNANYTVTMDEIRASNAGFNDFVAVPEPQTVAILALGLGFLLVFRRPGAARPV